MGISENYLDRIIFICEIVKFDPAFSAGAVSDLLVFRIKNMNRLAVYVYLSADMVKICDHM